MPCAHNDSGAAQLPGVDALASETFRAFKRAMHLNRQLLMRSTAGRGTHPAQVGCMMMLSHHPDVTQRELAERLHIAPATVTTMLQRMERQGTIERYADEHDQRVMRVRLTHAGLEQSRELGASHAAYINAVLGGLSEDDSRELTRLLNLIGDRVEAELGQ